MDYVHWKNLKEDYIDSSEILRAWDTFSRTHVIVKQSHMLTGINSVGAKGARPKISWDPGCGESTLICDNFFWVSWVDPNQLDIGNYGR